jgi:hypothetical protein
MDARSSDAVVRDPGYRPPGDARTERPRGAGTEVEAWVFDGVLAGVIGAAVIAVFFFAIDIGQGQPFRTPGALGSQLFVGQTLPPGATPEPALVFGYTALHGAVFVSAGLMASFALLGQRKRLGRLAGFAVAAALFAGFEVFFLVFAELMAPGLSHQLGTGRIAGANLLAALAMSRALLRPRLPAKAEG